MEKIFEKMKELQDNKIVMVENENIDLFFRACDVFGINPNGGAFVITKDPRVVGQWFYI